MNRINSKEFILNLLDNNIDEVMLKKEFRRRKKSNIYYKKDKTSSRKMIFSYHTNPYYNPSAWIRIYPYLEFKYPELINEAKKIFLDNYDKVFCTDKFVLRQPVGYLVKTNDWIINKNEDHSSVTDIISDSLNNIIIPIVDRCSSLEGFVNEFTMTNNISNHEQIKIYIIISMILINEIDRARDFLEKHFNKKGLQEIYTPLFNYYFIDK